MKQSIKKSIKLLELCFNIHLSKQQRAVVQYDLKTPVRVISCAGSGKTMLFLFMALALIVNGQTQPKNILGVTFSKRAQLDMGRRYNADLKKMHYWGADKYVPDSAPYFTTFHALFYRLLKKLPEYHNFRVITSYIRIASYLCKGIRFKSKEMSTFEQLAQMFTERNKMLNKGITFDGLHMLKHPLNYPSDIAYLLLKQQNIKDKTLWRHVNNYRNVMSLYNRYKDEHHLLDFSDMMTKLYVIMNRNMEARELLQNQMKSFHYAFLDEFQDINDLQWQLMRLLLSDMAWNHLMIIGDDDQSIYSFRGSNPNIILNFQHRYPKTHTFMLSTNYRTGGNILNITKPMIEKNQYRLDKKLGTSNKGKGKVIEYFSHNKHNTANQMLLNKLWKDIMNPRINNNDLAILVHYNNSRMFVIDWLATHRKYVKVQSSRYLLQNNHIYRIVMNGISGLVLNDLCPILNITTAIGQRSYQRFVNGVKSTHGLPKHMSLLHFLKIASQYSMNESNKSSNQELYADEKDVRQSKHKGEDALYLVHTLTRGYFSYMVQNHYMSKILVNSVFNYLDSELVNLNTTKEVAKFIYNEQKKKYILKKITRRKSFPIHIMSLHQSKGLQFKDVFLYDINARRDSPEEINLEKFFAPNLSLEQFIYLIFAMNKQQRDYIDSNNFDKYMDYSCNGIERKLSKYCKEHPKVNIDKVIKKLSEHKFDKNGGQFKIQQLIWEFYRQIIHSSKFIEEQRRLIYVGITRAQNKLYLAYNRDADPILNELAIPNQDKYYLEENGKVVNYQTDVKIQQKIMAKYRKKQKEARKHQAKKSK